jgi:2-C-methyl-D-erythritol 2,4-cyclodiphosphate synthase
VLLQQVYQLIQAQGWTIGNLDAVVIAEKPKLKPHIKTMRDRLAEVLGLESDRVSVKATTNEGLDAVGQQEGIAAYAVVLLCK